MTRSRIALLLVLSGAVFMEGVDVSMMGVALPSIRAELGLSTSELQWIVSAYVLGYGGFVLLGGRAADLLGRRRMFLAWMAVFVVFSGLGGIADSGALLIVARFVTGVAAGFMAPAGLSIITSSFPEGSERNRALLVYAGVAAAGFSLGMVVGGLLTAIGWRWVFFAPVVMASLLLVVAWRVVPRDTPTAERGAFDLGGALSLTGAMILLVFTVVRAPDVSLAPTLLGLVGSAALLAAFVVIERRAAAPLVRLGILRSASLVRANVGTMFFIGAFVAFQFVAVLYLQELRGWSSVETGLALMVLGIDAILAPTLTPRLVERFGKLPVIGAGMALAVVGYALFLPLGPDWTYLQMLPTILLVGVAFALTFGTLMIVATDGIAEAEQGLASGLQYVSLQFGAAVGLAVVAAVNVAATNGSSQAALLDGFQAALFVPVAAVVLGLVVTATALPGLRRASVIGACSST
ncbi:MFS transporter [Solirubrobacter taibaiensis]|nr:MFS transporter [Solirubrobacter taibaiensis]